MIARPHDKRIKEMEVHNRPRERMAERGAEALSDQELLAILIGSGNKERSVTTISGLGSCKSDDHHFRPRAQAVPSSGEKKADQDSQ